MRDLWVWIIRGVMLTR